MNKYLKHIIPSAILLLSSGITVSCVGDLDVTPIDPNVKPEVSAAALFNKCYANLGGAGNGGANGDCDMPVSSNSTIIPMMPATRCSMVTSHV